MPQNDKQPNLVQETFTFEEYIEVMAGIDGRVVITDPEQAPWTAETLDLDGIILQRMFEGGSNTYEGESAEGLTCLCLRIPTPSEVYAYGQSWDVDRMAFVRPGYSVTSITNDVLHYYALTLPNERILAAMENFDPAHTESLLGGPCMVDITPESGRHASETAGSIMATAGGTRVFRNPQARQTAASELLKAFLEAFTSRTPSALNVGRPKIPRNRMLRKIRDYLHRPERWNLSVPDLAAHVGVAERTLRNVFREHFGVSPKKYLQIIQVHEIRADLVKSRPGTTVTTIAADHGVWDYGRLAQRYRRVFGETPSQTLAGSRIDATRPVLFAESG